MALDGSAAVLLRLKDIQPDHFRKIDFFRTCYAHARLADEVGIIVERCDGSHIFVSLGLACGTGTFSKRGYDALDAVPIRIADCPVRDMDNRLLNRLQTRWPTESTLMMYCSVRVATTYAW